MPRNDGTRLGTSPDPRKYWRVKRWLIAERIWRGITAPMAVSNGLPGLLLTYLIPCSGRKLSSRL